MLSVKDLRAFLANKSDDDTIEIVSVPNYQINVKPFIPPVAEEQTPEAVDEPVETNNAAEATTEAQA